MRWVEKEKRRFRRESFFCDEAQDALRWSWSWPRCTYRTYSKRKRMKVDPLLILRENYFHIYIAFYFILSELSQKNRVFNSTKASRRKEMKRKEMKWKEKKWNEMKGKEKKRKEKKRKEKNRIE